MSSNVIRQLGRGMWFVERGLDQVVGVVVELPDSTFTVFVYENTAPNFLTSEDAIQHARELPLP